MEKDVQRDNNARRRDGDVPRLFNDKRPSNRYADDFLKLEFFISRRRFFTKLPFARSLFSARPFV